jgi:hypothetical protein
VAGVVSSALLLAGCGSDTLAVDSFPVTAVGHERCPTLLAGLPDRVSDQGRRATTGSTFAAAYGDPAIVVRCGVGKPKGFDKFATCNRANGIDWFVSDLEKVVEDQSLDVRMTTVGRSPALQVDLPAQYRPPTTAMVDLERAIKKYTKKTGGCLA